MSTRMIYQPRELYINSNQRRKRKRFWTTQPCGPGRFINCDRQSQSMSGPAVYHQHGVVVYQQPSKSKSKAKALLDDTAMSTRAITIAISKVKHIWRKCVSPARYINRDQQSESISELYTRAYLSCISTTNKT